MASLWDASIVAHFGVVRCPVRNIGLVINVTPYTAWSKA